MRIYILNATDTSETGYQAFDVIIALHSNSTNAVSKAATLMKRLNSVGNRFPWHTAEHSRQLMTRDLSQGRR
jgi:hypothetical protein